jgi:GNAT superfamily N-acetyltransferase
MPKERAMQKFRLVRCEGDDAEELHKLAFAADYWPGDGHTYWIARDAAGAVAGFCSAVYWVDIRCVFLSRAAVTTEARGCGLQRLMIAQRILWAQEEGAKAVYTYTEQHNYPSVINLIKAGFRFAGPVEFGWHHFILGLEKRAPLKRIFKEAYAKTD